MFNKLISKLNKDLTESPFKTVLLTGGLFVFLFVVFYAIYCLVFDQIINPVAVFVDMVSPATLRNYTYETTLNNPILPARHILYLVVYLAGIVVFSGVFIATLTTFIRSKAEMIRRGDTRFQLGGHVLVLGYDNRLIGTITRLAKTQEIVLVIESDVDKLRSELKLELDNDTYKKITFIHANKNEARDLEKKLKLKKAKEIYIIGGEGDISHDNSNLDCFVKICELCDKGEVKVPNCNIYFRDSSTFALFQSHIGIEEKYRASFHPFSFDELWARKLLVDIENDYPKLDYRSDEDNIAVCPEKYVHLLILGMSSMGEMLARVTTMLAHFPNYITHGKKTKITIVDPDIYSKMEGFTGRFAEFFKLCRYQYCEYSPEGKHVITDNAELLEKDFLDLEYEFIKSSYSNTYFLSDIEVWSKENSFLTIAVCEDAPYKSMEVACFLPHRIYEDRIPILVYQMGSSSISSFLDNSKYKNFHIFGCTDVDVMDEKQLMEWAMMLAREYEVEYAGSEEQRREVLNSTKEALWNNTIVSDQWSNIYNVASLPSKLRAMGTSIDAFLSNPIEFGAKERDLLGRIEHNRWDAEKLMMGYRPTDPHEQKAWNEGKKKDLKKLFIHDNIRPFDELSKDDQDKDILLWDKLCNIVRNR